MPNLRAVAAVLSMLVLVVAGCGGDSAEEQAQSDVCSARADIKSSLDELKGMTASTVTTDAVREQLDAIREGLGKMRDAEADLNEERRSQLQAANAQFADTIRTVAQTVVRSVPAGQASAQVEQAVGDLTSAYESTLTAVDCDT